MSSPAFLGPSDPDAEFQRLLRGYGAALLFVVGMHVAGWMWTRSRPVETPVVIPPMVDVELITPPVLAPAEKPAPASPPAAAGKSSAATSPPKKVEAAPKPKAKPTPPPKAPPKPVEAPRPVPEHAPVKPAAEAAEAAHPVPKAVPAPAASATSSSGSSVKPPARSGVSGEPAAGNGSGGGEQKVTPAHDAGYLHNPKPRYPPIAVARNWEGLVRLRVYVLPNGAPGQVLLQQSSGHDALDQAALEVVQRWRFVPAKRGEQAMASWVVVPLVFKLNSDR